MASTSESDRDGDFMSKAYHLKYRSLTTLLYYLQSASETLRGKELSLPDHTKSHDVQRIYKYLAPHANALVRDNEVLALLPASETVEGSSVVIVEQPNPQFLVARNPKWKEHPTADGVDGTDPVLKVTPNTQTVDNSDLLQLLRAAGPGQTFDSHCQTYLSLVKATHTCSDRDRPEHVQHLKRYVFFMSAEKIHRRFRFGMSIQKRSEQKKNLYDALTDKLAGKQVDECSPPGTDKFLKNDLPNREQASILKQVFKNDPAIADKPLYDAEGRLRFQELLATTLSTAEAGAKALCDAKKTFLDPKTSSLDDETLLNTLDRAIRQVHSLSIVRRTFADLLLSHFRWVCEVHELRYTSHKYSREEQVEARENPSSDSAPGLEDVSQMPYIIKEPEADRPNEQGLEEGDLEKEELEEGLEGLTLQRTLSTVDDEAAEYRDLFKSQKSDWASVAFKYSTLVCLHNDAVQQVKGENRDDHDYDEQYSRYIQKASVTTVEVQPTFRDRRMPSVSNLLDELLSEQKEMFKDKIIEYLIEKVKGLSRSMFTKEVFDGTWHCENILLSMVALQKSQRQALAAGGTVKNEGMFELPSDLVKMFKHAKPAITVSKRCCPACFSLVKQIDRTNLFGATTSMIYPGHHAVWSAVALPPWLPYGYAKGVYAYAETEAKRLLGTIMDKLAIDDRETRQKSRSPGSPMHTPAEKKVKVTDFSLY